MYVPAPNDKQFELPPTGTHIAVCYRVIDLGTQSSTWNGRAKRQHKILISWELPEEKMDDGRPFTIGQRYTWSMSEKAALRRDLESWRGVPFGDDDFDEKSAARFDIRNIIGKACLLNIVYAEKNDKRYANIASISRLMKGQKAPDAPQNDPTYLWINEDRWDSSVFSRLSDGLKGVISQSPEYASMMNGGGGPDQHITDAHSGDFHDEEIPF